MFKEIDSCRACQIGQVRKFFDLPVFVFAKIIERQ